MQNEEQSVTSNKCLFSHDCQGHPCKVTHKSGRDQFAFKRVFNNLFLLGEMDLWEEMPFLGAALKHYRKNCL